jgi:hypothetical protein
LAGAPHLLTYADAASASRGASFEILLYVFSAFLILRKLSTLTMAEVAGLVLGAIPLIFLALDKYQACLEFGKHYARYTDTLMSIRDEVSIQQMLFQDTMKAIGLHEPTYVELEDCLQIRFPEHHKTLVRCIKGMDSTIAELMERLEVDTTSRVSTMEVACGIH